MTPTILTLIRRLFSLTKPSLFRPQKSKGPFKFLGVMALSLSLFSVLSFKVFSAPNYCNLNLNSPFCGGSPIPPPPNPSPLLQVSPSNLSFGGINIGDFSPAQDLTLTNTDPNPITLGYISITVDYLITSHSTCSQQMSLASGQSCTLSVLFAPQSLGTNNGFLTIGVIDSNNNATGVPIPLSGTGTFTLQPTPIVQLNPSNLAFGSIEVGNLSQAQTITLTNTDSSSITLGYFGITVDYIVTGHSTCRQQMALAPGKSCTLSVIFNPQNVGTNNGYLTLGVIDSNNSATPFNVPLSGAGTISVTPFPNPNPTSKPPPTLCPIPPTGNNPSPTPTPTPIPTPSPNANNVPAAAPNSPSGNNSENAGGAGGGCSLGATSGSPWGLLSSLLTFPFLGFIRASRKSEDSSKSKDTHDSSKTDSPSVNEEIKKFFPSLLKMEKDFFQFLKKMEPKQKSLNVKSPISFKAPEKHPPKNVGLIDDLQEHLSFRWWEGSSWSQRALGLALAPLSAVTMGAATLVGALGAGCSPEITVYCDNGSEAVDDGRTIICKPRDGSATDRILGDGAKNDARTPDASSSDRSVIDARFDSSTTDARPSDARAIDGPRDGGVPDARRDGGSLDARPSDAQVSDARLDARG